MHLTCIFLTARIIFIIGSFNQRVFALHEQIWQKKCRPPREPRYYFDDDDFQIRKPVISRQSWMRPYDASRGLAHMIRPQYASATLCCVKKMYWTRFAWRRWWRRFLNVKIEIWTLRHYTSAHRARREKMKTLLIIKSNPSYRLRLLRTWSVQPLLRSDNLACLELADSRKRGSVCDFHHHTFLFLFFFWHKRKSRPRLLILYSENIWIMDGLFQIR
jgi:hypothetical protein